MRKLLSVCVVCAVALSVTSAHAGSKTSAKLAKLFGSPKASLTNYQPPAIEPQPMPGNAPAPAATPVAPGATPVPTAQGTPVALYNCVRYKDECNVAPCAVPMVVMVKDPCDCNCDPCCAPKCVAVQICVPPCSTCPPQVCCKRGGEYVSYDYGKYRVEITSRNGVVTVDYDD